VTSDVLLQALRYNRWANLRLLEVCSGLTDDQLQLSSPGTYGAISSTFQHMLAAEQRYLRRLVGFEPELSEDDEFPGMAKLTEHAERSGEQLINSVGHFNPDDASRGRNEWDVKNWVVMTQAIHHGNDHRTHICTILGQNGISYGDLDVWAFADTSDGYVKC
jgi:uncharacterized damage-inducible protein DinB